MKRRPPCPRLLLPAAPPFVSSTATSACGKSAQARDQKSRSGFALVVPLPLYFRFHGQTQPSRAHTEPQRRLDL